MLVGLRLETRYCCEEAVSTTSPLPRQSAQQKGRVVHARLDVVEAAEEATVMALHHSAMR